MGSTLVKAVEGKSNPTVGLLNIGSEEIKGNEVVKKAGELLRASALNFHGNVEGDDIYKGTTDVVVCDGFAGNVALKTSEGLAKMLGDFLKGEYTRDLFSRLASVVSYPVLKRFPRRGGPPPRGCRPHRAGDVHPRHGLSVERLSVAGEARRETRGGLRRSSSLLGIRLRARHRRPLRSRGAPPLRAGDRRRSVLANPGLEGSRNLRAFW